MKMQVGRKYVIHAHLDDESYRIVASAKVERYLSKDRPEYASGDEVNILIWQKTDLGFKVIVDNRFSGLVYENGPVPAFTYGRPCAGYISKSSGR